jgi:hypothetical protein
MGKTPDRGFMCQKRSLTLTGLPMAANPDVPAHGCAETSRQVLRQDPDLAVAYGFCWRLWDTLVVGQSVKRSSKLRPPTMTTMRVIGHHGSG